jgi:hypothetical protein
MKSNRWCALIVLMVMVLATHGYAEESYKIGVLAKNGPVK